MSRKILAFALMLLAVGPAFSGEVLSGSWKGTWTSSANGHTGPLNARIDTGNGNTVVVHFRGRFAKIVPFVYRSQLAVVSEDEQGTHLEGSQRLPLFGTFTTQATVKDGQFLATFQSGKDSGEFRMTRTGN
jgi:hypothetical protein